MTTQRRRLPTPTPQPVTPQERALYGRPEEPADVEERIRRSGELTAEDQVFVSKLHPDEQRAFLSRAGIPDETAASILQELAPLQIGSPRPLIGGRPTGTTFEARVREAQSSQTAMGTLSDFLRNLNPVGSVVGPLIPESALPGPARRAFEFGASLLSPLTLIAPSVFAAGTAAAYGAGEAGRAAGLPTGAQLGLEAGAGLLGAGGAVAAPRLSMALRPQTIIPQTPVTLAAPPLGAAQTLQNLRLAAPPAAKELFGLEDIPIRLTIQQRAMNAVKDLTGIGIKAEETVTPVVNMRVSTTSRITSQANRIANENGSRLRSVFKMDQRGFISNLEGVDPSIEGSPSLADVAARLPRYLPKLTDEQITALRQLEDDLAPLRRLYDEVGIDLSKRGDVVDGGFYIPRGGKEAEGLFEESLKQKVTLGKGGGGKPGFERAAYYESQAAAAEAGVKQAPFETAITDYVQGAGRRAVDKHIENFFQSSGLGETPKMRAFRRNPALVGEMDDLRANVGRLRSVTNNLDTRVQGAIDEFLNDPLVDNIDDLRSAIDGINSQVVVRSGLSKGKTLTDLQDALEEVKVNIRDLSPDYKRALKLAQSIPEGQGVIGQGRALRGLQSLSFPDEVANAANKELAVQLGEDFVGRVKSVLGPIIQMYRFTTATLDNSAPGIQGLLATYRHPIIAAKTLGITFRAWGRNGDRVLGSWMMDADAQAAKEGLPPLKELAARGLRLGSNETEFDIPRGVAGVLTKVPGMRQANRAFGFYGDALRGEWAYSQIRDALREGRTLDELRASGEIEKITEVSNLMTGWSKGRAAGNMGDLLLYAPRFLQARLETTAKAALGLRPGAPLDQREALRSIIQMVGLGTGLTVAVNEMLGNETDFRPVVDGKRNPNFLRVRLGGRDWSLFGTWDSLAAIFVSAGSGDPGQMKNALTGLASLPIKGVDTMFEAAYGNVALPTSPQDWTTGILKEFMPFASQELPEVKKRFQEGEVGAGLLTLTGEVFGAKSARLSLTDLRDIESIQRYGKRYADLDNRRQRDAVDSTPEIGERMRQRDTVPISKTQRFGIIREAEERRTDMEKALGEEFSRNALDPQAFRDRYAAIEATYAAESLRDIQQPEEMKKAYDSYQETGVLPDYKALGLLPKDEHKAAIFLYMQPFKLATSRSGNVDFEAVDRLHAQIEAGWTHEQKDYVKQYLLERTYSHPLVEQYVRFRAKLRDSGWYDLERIAKSIPKTTDSPGWADLNSAQQKFLLAWVDEHTRRGEQAKEDFIRGSRDPIKARALLTWFENRLSDQRDIMRVKDPEIDKGEVLFYGSPPRTLSGLKALVVSGRNGIDQMIRGAGKRLTTEERDILTNAGVTTIQRLAASDPIYLALHTGLSMEATRYLVNTAKRATE